MSRSSCASSSRICATTAGSVAGVASLAARARLTLGFGLEARASAFKGLGLGLGLEAEGLGAAGGVCAGTLAAGARAARLGFAGVVFFVRVVMPASPGATSRPAGAGRS